MGLAGGGGRGGVSLGWGLVGPASGQINLDTPADYMEAVDREDEKLERTMGTIRTRTDAGELTLRESALERGDALESHLAECQRLRRMYLAARDEGLASGPRAAPAGRVRVMASL